MTLLDRDNNRPVTEPELFDGYSVPRDFCSGDLETAGFLAYEGGRDCDDDGRLTRAEAEADRCDEQPHQAGACRNPVLAEYDEQLRRMREGER